MDTQILISEFIGTAVLMAFGSGVNSSVLLKNTLAKAFAPNWMSLIFGWGLAVTFAVYIGIALGGPAHLNPAITISFAAGGLFRGTRYCLLWQPKCWEASLVPLLL